MRLTSSSFAGTSRKLVATGTARLASMLAARRAPGPRNGSPSGGASTTGARSLRAGTAAGPAGGVGGSASGGGASGMCER